MKTVKKTIKILINTPLLGQKKGSSVTLATDRGGKVINAFWAARIKDAETDNCVTLITTEGGEKAHKKTIIKKGEK